MIEVIDKRNNTVYDVSLNFQIKFNNQICKLKDLEFENLKIIGVIFQKNGEIDLCYKERD